MSPSLHLYQVAALEAAHASVMSELRRYFATLVALSLVLLSCTPGLPQIPRAPVYDAQCEPSHSYYRDLARDAELRPDYGNGDVVPAMGLQLVHRELEALGYEVRYVDGYGTTGFTCWTLPGVIQCDSGLRDELHAKQAETLSHEGTHAKQQVALGWPLFASLWASAEGRRALENAARSEQYQMRLRMGGDVSLAEWQRVLRKDEKRYGWVFGPAPSACTEAAAVSLWMEELPDFEGGE